MAFCALPSVSAGEDCDECIELCNQCNADGSNTADCQTVCQIAGEPTETCDEQCAETLHLGGGGGETSVPTTAPAPTDPVVGDSAPAPTPASGTGFPPGTACQVCKNQCEGCGGGGSASCKTVCEISKEEQAICDQRCYDTLHLGCWIGSGNVEEPDCECKSLCQACGDSTLPDCVDICTIAADASTCESKCAEKLGTGSASLSNAASSDCICDSLCTQCGGVGTADCMTVCEIAKDAATCPQKCAETLHLGEYYQGTNTQSTPTSSGYSRKIGTVSVVAASAIGALLKFW